LIIEEGLDCVVRVLCEGRLSEFDYHKFFLEQLSAILFHFHNQVHDVRSEVTSQSHRVDREVIHRGYWRLDKQRVESLISNIKSVVVNIISSDTHAIFFSEGIFHKARVSIVRRFQPELKQVSGLTRLVGADPLNQDSSLVID